MLTIIVSAILSPMILKGIVNKGNGYETWQTSLLYFCLPFLYLALTVHKQQYSLECVGATDQ